jgi:hypothetical protein
LVRNAFIWLSEYSCMYGAHYVSASDADGNVGFSRLFLALALNSESEKSLKPNTQIAR